MKKYAVVFLVIFVFCKSGSGQKKGDTLTVTSGTISMLPVYHPWLYTDNAGGMAIHPLTTIGQTQLGYNIEEGGFRRPQQAEKVQQLRFHSERYQALSHLLLYGGFQFIRQKDHNLQLTDVMDPYNGNPYIIADSLGGNWSKQLYELNLKASTLTLAGHKLSLGLAINYKAGSGARQNDPRPLTTTNSLTLKPGVVWNISPRSHLGIDAMYNTAKEEVSIYVNAVGSSQYIYKITGPGIYLSEVVPGLITFIRNYNGHTFGGDIQYEFAVGNLKWLSSAGMRSRRDVVTDGITIPRAGGRLEEKSYHLQTAVIYKPANLIHTLRFNWVQYDRAGREYFQDFNSGIKYETIYTAILTTSLTTNASVTYELIAPRGNNDYHWNLSVAAAFAGLDNMYLLPRSRQIADRSEFSLSAANNCKLDNTSNIELTVRGIYTAPIKSKADNIGMANGSNYIATRLFLPDHGYLSSSSFAISGSALYSLFVPAAPNTRFFVKASGNICQQTGTEKYGVSGHRSTFSLSVGAFY